MNILRVLLQVYVYVGSYLLHSGLSEEVNMIVNGCTVQKKSRYYKQQKIPPLVSCDRVPSYLCRENFSRVRTGYWL